MKITRYLIGMLAPLAFAYADDSIRSFEFTVYGQRAVRGVAYQPISAAATEQGLPAEEPVTIETHYLSRMGPYQFRGENRVTFFSQDDDRVVGRVDVPEGSTRWLFVFVNNPRYRGDPEGQLPYLIYPFDDSTSNLPANSLLFLNISGKELDGLVENKRVKLGPGESEAQRVQESLPVSLWTLDFRGEKLLPALNKTYTFERDKRYLMIFFPPVRRGSSSLDVRVLSDALELSQSE